MNGLYVDGAWQAGEGAPLTLIDPCTAMPFARISTASPPQLDAAVSAALRALPAWRRTPAQERAALLARIADLIDARTPQLVECQMRCNGKPRHEAELDVSDAAGTFRYYAGLCSRAEADQPASIALPDPSFHGEIHLEAVGVCALIVPWNFPMVTTAWKLAPALAAGCTAIVKPSELTPLAEIELMQLIHEAGVPPGVVNLVAGGRDVGERLVAHRHIAKVSFTGSTAAGRAVMQAAAARMQRVSLELGGKSALIVFDDADLDAAVDLAFNGAFFNAGQMCSATSRVLVHASLHKAFVERLKERARNAVVGAPSVDNVSIGPLISAAQRDRVVDFIARGKAEGANLVCGGPVSTVGFFVAPSIFVNVAADSVLWTDEIFGPVVAIRCFETEQEAIDATNDSDYGLVATIATRDSLRAQRVAAACEVGMVWINAPQVIFPQTAWGGRKLSGIGRELGPSGLRAYQEIKHVVSAV